MQLCRLILKDRNVKSEWKDRVTWIALILFNATDNPFSQIDNSPSTIVQREKKHSQNEL